MLAESQQPLHVVEQLLPPELDELDVLLLDASSPPLLLVLVDVPPPSSPPLDEVLYELLEPPDADPDAPPDDPLFEPPKLLLLIPPDPPEEPNLPVGTGSPAAHAPTTPLATTAKTSAATLNPPVCIDSLVYAQPRLKQRRSTSQD
jgi:hypothetical protein